jgi:hypothetical protein
MKANQALAIQMETIRKAIELLQAKADAIIDTTNPDDATWKDVARFAQAADAAQCVIERLS